MKRARPFPFFGHRTLAEVDETAMLLADRHIRLSERKRLARLLRMRQRNNPPPPPAQPPAAA